MSRPNNVDNVALSQHNSDEANKILKLMKRETKWVLGELLYQCMVCRTVECNGELCLRGCYRCGDRRHSSNGCTFTTIKLEKILANKGVCFGCYDTLQHTMIKHDQYKCPLKKRLKRLFFKDRESNGMDHEAYLRKVYASEMSFVTIVASYATDTVLGRYVPMLFVIVLIKFLSLLVNTGYGLELGKILLYLNVYKWHWTRQNRRCCRQMLYKILRTYLAMALRDRPVITM